ncbi:MAG: hypothetical protein WCE30_21845 [Mycobacterium sp.]
MTDTHVEHHAEVDFGDVTAAPTSIEEVSDYLARVSAELNERKAAVDEAARRFEDVAQSAQLEIDDVTRRALVEVRDVQRRVDAEIGDTQARLTEQVESAGRERDDAIARYNEAIDKIVASGLVARKMLTSLGFTPPRGRSKSRPVVSKIKAKDVELTSEDGQ